MSNGQLRKHEGLRSRFLRNQRDLIVYLPPGYDDQPFAKFPVLYLHDGQNLFDRATAFGGQDWNVHGAADHMIGIGAVQPLIIVGIYNTGKSRIHEYTPTQGAETRRRPCRSLRKIPDRRGDALHPARISRHT